MTREHFQAIADEIATISNRDEAERTAERMARVCQQFNANFNKARFMTACGC